MTGPFLMHPYEDHDISYKISLSKQAALQALQHYDLDWKQIRFNQLSDTCTFFIDTDQDGAYLLRIYSGMRSEELESELDLLDVLNEKMDVPLPKGLPARGRSACVRIDLENGASFYAALLSWVEGEHPKRALTNEEVYREGILLAKLHRAAGEFAVPPGFARPVWGEESFRRSMARLTQYYDRFLTDAEFRLYQEASEKIFSWVGTLDKSSGSYGIVHGDLHQGNIVFHNGEPRPIDFGRCGFGYFLYDIAHMILGYFRHRGRS
ncbi:phosphotransferase enzyme family protein [Paenibacillus hamazuiensis]|uniref:phosphotransferase enzyme family protein n=1 Tax=Paenibacillus hamazuiensis TaxID=2936508 RepID=UPI00200BDCE0|nr:phosphotransferase [Paenibacillus hamazuiensis]